MTEPTAKYPELEKLRAIADDSQKIGEFLKWLGDQGIELCSVTTRGHQRLWWGNRSDEYLPIDDSDERLLSRYFQIDLDQVRREKQAVFEEQRALTLRTMKPNP